MTVRLTVVKRLNVCTQVTSQYSLIGSIEARVDISIIYTFIANGGIPVKCLI